MNCQVAEHSSKMDDKEGEFSRRMDNQEEHPRRRAVQDDEGSSRMDEGT